MTGWTVALMGVSALGCGSHHRQAPRAHARPAPPAAKPSPAPPPRPPQRPAPVGDRPLAIGLTESNANLLWSPEARPRLPGSFAPWRDRLRALTPAYLRIDVDWSQLQPHAGSPVHLGALRDGCSRRRAPCAAYHGIADELGAVASEQKDRLGFEPVINIFGVPAWAARRASGCERPATQARSRPISSAGIAAYRRLIGELADLGRRQGVALRYWSAWNEPNHPFFISPQRARCLTASPSLSVDVYSALVRALVGELGSQPGEHHVVLGELANIRRPEPRGTGVAEFIDALPADVICASRTWSVHSYPGRTSHTGSDAVASMEEALAARGRCGREARIWVTETGEGSPHVGEPRSRDPAKWRAGCRLMASALERWRRDPRVEAAFQYTFREDPGFAVGLADPALTGLYPSYYLWRAWSRARSRSEPPPVPAECA